MRGLNHDRTEILPPQSASGCTTYPMFLGPSRCRRCRKYQYPYDGSPWNRGALFARIQEIARHSKFEDGHRLIRRHRSAFQSIAFLCQFALWCNRWKALLRVRRREVKTWLKCWPQVNHDL